MLGFIVLLALVVILVIYLIGIYNGLVTLRESVKQAWANIDVLLKQRHDELPKLIDTCKRYMQYEQETLEKVMRARAAVSDAGARNDMPALSAAESQLRGSVTQLYAVAENYPQLKTDQSFQQLQARISGLEDAIADRREFYNNQVTLNNARVAQFPDVLIARNFGFGTAVLLHVDEQDKHDVDVGALFKS